MDDWKEKYKRTIDEEIKKLFDKYFYKNRVEVQSAIDFLNNGFEALDISLDEVIPNIMITGNNKTVEVLHEFKKKGLSIFVLRNADGGDIEPNLVGNAIIEDIKNRTSEGVGELTNLVNMVQIIYTRISEGEKAIDNMGFFQKLRLIIASLLVPEIADSYINMTDDEFKSMGELLDDYSKNDTNLFDYDYRKELVPALADLIQEIDGYSKDYKYFGQPDKVIPVLKKLELEDLIPVLKEELEKRNIPTSILYPPSAPTGVGQQKTVEQVSVDTKKTDIDDEEIDF